MREIIIRFLTKKGEEAYKKVSGVGGDEKRIHKKIVNRVFKEQIIKKNPLEIKIILKIPWLAEKTNLLGSIQSSLKKYSAQKNKDYKLEVIQ